MMMLLQAIVYVMGLYRSRAPGERLDRVDAAAEMHAYALLIDAGSL